MINCKKFYDKMKKLGIGFFTGVPDSLLKDFCAYVTDHSDEKDHIISANEGNSIGLAAGYHLATGNIGLVYMQNSGLGNAVNPLTSLTDKEVYSIPTLLLIGWRGEPGVKDEPQHNKKGKITLEILDILDISYDILSEDMNEALKQVEKAYEYMKENNSPYAIVVKKGTFEEYELKKDIKTEFELSREDAVELVLDALDEKDVVVSTTGKTSREVFEYRERNEQGHDRDFLTVGSMGHCSSIALGIALQDKNRDVFCIDGDGAVIMHMGSLSINGHMKSKNFKHIVINNGAHDSVGGQPTVGFDVDFAKLAIDLGYNEGFVCETAEEIKVKIKEFKKASGPVLMEIRVNKGARKDLGRPTSTPQENKKMFMKFLRG
jgi:phosphonopyruvate decarboxylase